MVYSVADMDFDEFLLGYCTTVGDGDMIVLDRRVIGRINLDKSDDREIAARLGLISKEKGLVLLAPVRLTDGEGVFNSVIVFDRGKVVGIADEINPTGKYDAGDSVAVFGTSKGNVGVIVGHDLFYAQVAELLSRVHVRYIVFCSAQGCDDKTLAILRALSVYVGCKCYGCMSDLSVEIESGNVTGVEVGRLRPMSDLTTGCDRLRCNKPITLMSN